MIDETRPAAGALEDGRRYRVLEDVDVVTLLGLRFWDAVRDEPIRDGLIVRAWPAGPGRPVAEAFRTRSGVYAFQNLPGMRRFERPMGTGSEPIASPPVPRSFVVSVLDPSRRFLPVAFTVDLPLADPGLFLTAPPDPGSPGGPGAPGVYLFSSPVRPRAPELAVIRGELVDATTGEAAGHALVRLDVAGGDDTYVSLSDSAGRFAVLLPFPTLTGRLGGLSGSPPDSGSPPQPIGERTWDIELRVAWDPNLPTLADTGVPEYRDILSQSEAGVLLDATSPPGPSATAWSGVLDFGGEVVVRSAGRSRLFIVPGGSSP